MKKILLASIAGLALLAFTNPSWAADEGAAKERTITGEAKCAKCALKESDKCQTVLQAENRRGKMVTYYLADNETAKKFHHDICQEPKKVKITGAVKREEGKQVLTASKIEEVK